MESNAISYKIRRRYNKRMIQLGEGYVLSKNNYGHWCDCGLCDNPEYIKYNRIL